MSLHRYQDDDRSTHIRCTLAIIANGVQVAAHELGGFGQYLRGVTIGDI
jgi:hypothetical protein